MVRHALAVPASKAHASSSSPKLSFRLCCMCRLSFFALFAIVVCHSQEVASSPSARYRSKPESQSQAAGLTPNLKAHLPLKRSLTLGPVSDREFARLASLGGEEPVGLERAVPGRLLLDTGSCEASSGGGFLWMLTIRSPEASSLRAHFDHFSVDHNRVWVSDKNGDQILGPYTARGLFGDGEFWSGVVFTDSIVIALEGDRGGCPAEVPFRITEVAHLWLDATINIGWESPLRAWKARQRNAGPQAGESNPGAFCNLDVSCYPDWQSEANSVARITYISNGGSFLCSGALINTKPYSGTPYFLTANHCISDDSSARTVTAFWGYQTTSCDGPAPAYPPFQNQSIGATYVASASFENGDFSLIQLNALPVAADLVFAGWTTEEPNQGDNATGIHHPGNSNDYKRISFGYRVEDQAIALIDENNVTHSLPPQDYFRVQWASGVTQGGSSGSPMFMYSNIVSENVIGGSLTFGPKDATGSNVCSISPFVAGYGRFSVAYPSLRTYLNPTCTFDLSSPNQAIPATGGSYSVDVNVEMGCSWTSTSDSDWLTITGGFGGSGNGTIFYSASANPWVNPRTGTLTIGNISYSVTQAGIPACGSAPISMNQTINSSLTVQDCMTAFLNNIYSKRFTFSGTAGQQVEIDVNAPGFDTYLRLFGPNGLDLIDNDDGGGGSNSRIPAYTGFYMLPYTGTYTIEVSSFFPGQTGTFALHLGVSGTVVAVAKFATYRTSGALGVWALDKNGNGAFDWTDGFYYFGLAADQAVAGDWTGDGRVRLGVFRGGTWYLDLNNNGRWDGTAGGDGIFSFGLPGDVAVVGDWNGDGRTKLGVFRCPPFGTPGLCVWVLDSAGKFAYDPATAVVLTYGLPGDQPVVSNWDGGNHDLIGVFRKGTWIVDSNGNGSWDPSDAQYAFGLPGDNPVVGNWFGSGRKRIGIFRPSAGIWVLDTNGSNGFDLSDPVFWFGLPGDRPVVGNWTIP